jgi:hypothetical protein
VKEVEHSVHIAEIVIMAGDIESEKVVGLDLGTFSDNLHHVPDELNRTPVLAFDAWERLGPDVQAYIVDNWGSREGFDGSYQYLSLEKLKGLSFDELCKMRHSSIVMMSNLEELFTKDHRYNIIRKIENSIWFWGSFRSNWNEIVDAYNGIRNFDLGLPGFDVVLDYTSYHNMRGHSVHSRTYLDGVFGLMIRHHGKHVMTLGFSVSDDRKLLVHQVQLAQPKGNRWLYSFPRHRLEFLIDRMSMAFPLHRILVVDGAELANRTIKGYLLSARQAGERAKKARLILEKNGDDEFYNRCRRDSLVEARTNRRKAAHLKGEVGRLADFYANTGHHVRAADGVRVNELTHYPVFSLQTDIAAVSPAPGL